MSVHDALEAWQQGTITASRAMVLSGASDVLELYGLADSCGVEIVTDLRDSEREKAATFTRSVAKAMSKKSRDGSVVPAESHAV